QARALENFLGLCKVGGVGSLNEKLEIGKLADEIAVGQRGQEPVTLVAFGIRMNLADTYIDQGALQSGAKIILIQQLIDQLTSSRRRRRDAGRDEHDRMASRDVDANGLHERDLKIIRCDHAGQVNGVEE